MPRMPMSSCPKMGNWFHAWMTVIKRQGRKARQRKKGGRKKWREKAAERWRVIEKFSLKTCFSIRHHLSPPENTEAGKWKAGDGDTIENRWSWWSSKKTCNMFVCAGGDSMANNKGFGKLLAMQRSIQESILWAGNWLALAAQYCPVASWDAESSLEHEKRGLSDI